MAARLYSTLFGPGNLGGTIGLMIASMVLGVHYSLESPEINLECFRYLLFGVASGWAGGFIGGMKARDELLREEWENSRWLVGLLGGAVVGGFLSAFIWDLWLFVAASTGGAFGGFLDAVVHRGHLEEGD